VTEFDLRLLTLRCLNRSFLFAVMLVKEFAEKFMFDVLGNNTACDLGDLIQMTEK